MSFVLNAVEAAFFVGMEAAIASNRQKIVVSWSGGKDSTLALAALQKDPRYEIVCLLTTVNEDEQKSSIHGVPISVLQEQARCLGYPLQLVLIPPTEKKFFKAWRVKMEEALTTLKREKHISGVAFGDLFAEDTCEFRYKYLKQVGLEGVFPLWKRNTAELVELFFQEGYKAVVCCVDDEHLKPQETLGQILSQDFIARLPSAVDLCGEHGEFHSFVFDGPIFKESVKFKTGEIVSLQKRKKCFHFISLELCTADGEPNAAANAAPNTAANSVPNTDTDPDTDSDSLYKFDCMASYN